MIKMTDNEKINKCTCTDCKNFSGTTIEILAHEAILYRCNKKKWRYIISENESELKKIELNVLFRIIQRSETCILFDDNRRI